MPVIDINSPNHNLPLSLLTPIAAKDLSSITNHIGNYTFIDGSDKKALIVDWLPYDNKPSAKLQCLEHGDNIHQAKQVWVTPDFKGYRKCYFDYFSTIENSYRLVVDHLFNRRLAKIWNYQYIRLIHIDRAVNSSSGRGQENFSVDLMKDDTKYWMRIRDRNISYADPFDLLKIVNQKIGKHPYHSVSDMFAFWYS
ncbi:MAG: hypothetical protein JNL75_03650 [Chitinophagales bacterium]|nr:hypothetical protein [Chitinophagales bacterium]